MQFNIFPAALPLSLAVALASQNASAATRAGPSFSLAGDYQDYNRGFGTKTLVTASAKLPVAPGTTLLLSAARGERATGAVALRGTGISATIQTPLSKVLTSRTLLTRGKAGALFAERSAGEELAYSFGSTEFRGGARVTRYAGGYDVRSAHAGLARGVGPLRLDYSLTAYARKGPIGSGIIHRFDGALKDHGGTTHLMLAAGSSLHEHDYRPDKVAGSFRFAGVKRKQKLGAGLSFELTGGWTAFRRPKGEYGAAKIGAGLSFAK